MGGPHGESDIRESLEEGKRMNHVAIRGRGFQCKAPKSERSSRKAYGKRVKNSRRAGSVKQQGPDVGHRGGLRLHPGGGGELSHRTAVSRVT